MVIISLSKKVRKVHSSFFLTLIIFLSCTNDNATQFHVSILWENDNANGLIISKSKLPDSFNEKDVKVYLSNSEKNIPVIGAFTSNDSSIVFHPVVPLTKGLSYEIAYRESTIERINIPDTKESGVTPKLLSIYPSADTLPENLLKFYFKFSHPMSHLSSFQHVYLLQEGDTLRPFLDLQNELWNKQRTLMTLWLDPGRIKRELVPNREEGNPLEQDSEYTLIVSGEWKDANGNKLAKGYKKVFYVGERDESSPNHLEWRVSVPEAGGRNEMIIRFNEPLDYTLVQENIRVLKEDTLIKGEVFLRNNERALQFIPEKEWERGSYLIRIKSNLEDLAGNNMNRLFDQEISDSSTVRDKEYYFLEFEVE